MANTTYTPEFLADRLAECLESGGDVTAFSLAMSRHYGRELAAAAYDLFCSRLPGLSAERRAELAARAAAYEPAPAPYKAIDRNVGEWVGGMYRFYCTLAAWPISPAARNGHILEGV